MMAEWLTILIRQLILYSLPVLISLTLVVLLESRLTRTTIPHPFFAVFWRGTWCPLLASMAFHRGIIIALPNLLMSGIKPAAIRFIGHCLLCLLGFVLFSWSLAHQAPTGLPPLHHWWAKVLMFFNLCMACLHLLPLPGLLVGECLINSSAGNIIRRYASNNYNWLVIAALAASPLLDVLLGATVVFPVYEFLSNQAQAFL
ncbi:MAG: hypothetical protein Q9M08_02085 [Mariprofundus sp.]|nr:hypothetical protein [Mariprofundus sp.]